MNNTRFRRGIKAPVSKILIIAGCICIAAAVCCELFSYPWFEAGELGDPSPPSVAYVDYADAPPPVYIKQAADLHTSLPAGESSEEFISVTPDTPSPAVTNAEAAEETERVEELPKYVRLGAVKIPRLSVSENLFEGTRGQLKYGVGHVEGTSLPGQEGNSVVAGHRVSTLRGQPFRYLDKMENGDTITVDFNGESFTYEVFDKFIVTMHDLWVLAPVGSETHVLTLLTCDPVVSVTDRVNRLIVRARLVV